MKKKRKRKMEDMKREKRLNKKCDVVEGEI